MKSTYKHWSQTKRLDTLKKIFKTRPKDKHTIIFRDKRESLPDFCSSY